MSLASVLSDRNQTQTATYCVMTLKRNVQNEQVFMETGSKQVAARRLGAGESASPAHLPCRARGGGCGEAW